MSIRGYIKKKPKKFAALLALLCMVITIPALYIVSKGEAKMEINLEVTSKAFENGGSFPVKYTGRGEDISIPLQFGNVSPSGKSIAVIMEDPDIPLPGTLTHWLVWNIPASAEGIPENIPHEAEPKLLNGAVQGRNSLFRTGYMGPKPPFGTHTYRIKVYVLDCFLELKPGSGRRSLEKAMKGHILQYGLLEGKFSR